MPLQGFIDYFKGSINDFGNEGFVLPDALGDQTDQIFLIQLPAPPGSLRKRRIATAPRS